MARGEANADPNGGIYKAGGKRRAGARAIEVVGKHRFHLYCDRGTDWSVGHSRGIELKTDLELGA